MKQSVVVVVPIRSFCLQDVYIDDHNHHDARGHRRRPVRQFCRLRYSTPYMTLQQVIILLSNDGSTNRWHLSAIERDLLTRYSYVGGHRRLIPYYRLQQWVTKCTHTSYKYGIVIHGIWETHDGRCGLAYRLLRLVSMERTP